jgi:hypothetical protein
VLTKATEARHIQLLVVAVESESEPVCAKANCPTGDSRSFDRPKIRRAFSPHMREITW